MPGSARFFLRRGPRKWPFFPLSYDLIRVLSLGGSRPRRLANLTRETLNSRAYAREVELQEHKAAFRQVFGDTLSDEFVDEMLTRLETALAPGP